MRRLHGALSEVGVACMHQQGVVGMAVVNWSGIGVHWGRGTLS